MIQIVTCYNPLALIRVLFRRPARFPPIDDPAMQALYLDDGRITAIDDHQVDPGQGEVVVDVIQAGICETDLQLRAGYMGFRGVPGHEFVGLAREGSFAGRRVVGEINCSCHQCPTCRAGRPTHCPHRSVLGILNHDGAFAEQVCVPERNLHLVPDDVSDDRATLVEPLAAAFQIPAQVDLSGAPQCVVIGDGRLAYLCAQVLRHHGCHVTVVGKHAPKRQRFESLGIETCDRDDVPETRDVDLAVECCGSPTGIDTAMKWLRPRGTLVLKTTVAAPHAASLAPLVIDEITVVGSRCGPFEPAIEAMRHDAIEVDSMITARYRLDQCQDAFDVAADGKHMKVVLSIAAGGGNID
ncbi:2-deoxy-scyllo-inosamine dehydrogenase [Crateriforma conspicua]|nr:2-deoxy-scyllo-inosamine dehydrogenase [Crateriforma conspicua]